jgi:hypothetical protein
MFRSLSAGSITTPSMPAETAAQADAPPHLLGDNDDANAATDSGIHPELRPFSAALTQHAGMARPKLHLHMHLIEFTSDQ